MWALVGFATAGGSGGAGGREGAVIVGWPLSKFLECLSAFLTYMPAPRCVAVRELRFRFSSYISRSYPYRGEDSPKVTE
jgi:hypothetical protein